MAVLVGSCSEGGVDPTAASPAVATTATTMPALTTTVSAPQASFAPTTVPQTDGEAFDYETVAVFQHTSVTPLGTIEWYKTSVVPSEWLYQGFPTPSFVADPFEYDRKWARVANNAQCCSTVTRTDDGWVGIGPSEGAAVSCPPLSVWTSADGLDWTVLHDDPFGSDGPCAAYGLVEQGGSAAFTGTGRSGSAIWVSHGMEQWQRVDIDFTEEGTDTYVTSVAAGPAGFAIFAVRVSHEPTARSESGIRLGHYPFEWVAWLSSGGGEWRRANMAQMFGTPWCKPTHPSPCGHIDALMTDDGILAYVHQAADSTIPDMRDGWALWIGLIE